MSKRRKLNRRTGPMRAMLLWKHRRMLARVTAIAFIVSLGIAFVIPKRYKSSCEHYAARSTEFRER